MQVPDLRSGEHKMMTKEEAKAQAGHQHFEDLFVRLELITSPTFGLFFASAFDLGAPEQVYKVNVVAKLVHHRVDSLRYLILHM
jgi:hypothetical protein